MESEEIGFILEPAQVEVGSGYAVSINYDEDRNPMVDITTYGEVNVPKIRRDIEKILPGATIRELKQAGSVKIVKKQRPKAKAKRARERKRNYRPEI